ncbi:MAG: demethoxyubiquinone hydroxylase family protein, partial [Proteobacteria bacterium]|nr:demethoxyubiquinone hydroxylase family protein [Pseudomonadota bacterium]
MAKKQKKSAQRITPQKLPGSPSDAALLARMLRVNHAGEYGAQRIYAGQLAVIKDDKLAGIINHMARQEDEHLAAFEKLLVERRVRPTALYPLWRVAGFALGAVTARMGPKAAMACTVAVEEVIDGHYRQQLAQLGQREPELRRLIAKFRAEENEHEAIGREHGAEEMRGYAVLRKLVRAG